VSSGAAVSLVTGNPLAAGTTTAAILLGLVRRSDPEVLTWRPVAPR